MKARVSLTRRGGSGLRMSRPGLQETPYSIGTTSQLDSPPACGRPPIPATGTGTTASRSGRYRTSTRTRTVVSEERRRMRLLTRLTVIDHTGIGLSMGPNGSTLVDCAALFVYTVDSIMSSIVRTAIDIRVMLCNSSRYIIKCV